MSLQPLEAPSDAFLRQGSPADRFLTEQAPPEPTPAVVDEDHRKAAVAIAGAFLAWRLFFAKHARQELPTPPSEPLSMLEWLWRRKAPIWLRIMLPSVREAMAFRGLTGEELEAVAVDYAEKMGSYIHRTSAEAVVAGYQEQLRRGVNPTLAWLRAIEGYGMTEKRLRSWVAQQAQSVMPDLISPSAQRSLDRALLARADVLGQTEGWHARQVAKSVAWMAQEFAGTLPRTARKRWLTRDDELVCKICGPLHRKEVGLRQQFVLPNGERLWAPGVHPNCRCELELVVGMTTVEKNVPGDPYNRNKDGEFAHQESRQRKTARPQAATKPREVDPVVQQLFAQMDQIKEEAPVEANPYAGNPYAEAANPYAEAANPYAANPYLANPYMANPYGEANPYGPEAANPYAGKKTGRRRRLWILVNGQMQEVDAEEVSLKGDRDHFVFVGADEFFALPRYDIGMGMTQDRRNKPGEPVDIHETDLAVGAPIDFDEYAEQAGWRNAQAEHRDLTEPEALPIEARVQRAGDGLPDLLGKLGDFYEWAEEELDDRMLQPVWEAESNAVEWATGDPNYFHDGLSDEAVVLIYADAGLTDVLRTHREDLSSLRQNLAHSVLHGEPSDPDLSEADASALSDAAYQWIIDHDDDVQAARVLVEETRPGYLRVPAIFTFKDNDAKLSDPGDGHLRVTGRYRVVANKIHPLVDVNDQGRAVRHHTGNPRIRAWREVVLEPMDDDEVG